jgi:hypothetical protein
MSAGHRSRWQQEIGFAGPFLRVEDPKDGLKTTEPFVVISGLTDPGVAVAVNDQKVPVDEEGRFMARVPLQDGENKLVVAATEGSSQTSMPRSVFYTNPAASISMSLSQGERENQAAASVKVLDDKGQPVPDGTPVRFATTLGKIAEEARTKGGQATAVLEVGPTDTGTAKITATSGRAQAEVSIDVAATGPSAAQPAKPEEPGAEGPKPEQPAEPAPAPPAAAPR